MNMIRIDRMLIAVNQIVSIKDCRPSGNTVIRMANGDQIVTNESIESIQHTLLSTTTSTSVP